MPDEDKDKNFLVVKNIVKVKESAVSISQVAGTPQNARIAVLNTSNQSIFLSSGGNSLLSGSGLIVQGKRLEEGEIHELSENLDGSYDESELDIETVWIQSDDAAQAMLTLIVKSFDMRYKEIQVSIFGNPLVQIGDFVRLSFKTGKVEFSSEDYWMVVGCTQSFEEGLKTDLILKPVTRIFGEK